MPTETDTAAAAAAAAAAPAAAPDVIDAPGGNRTPEASADRAEGSLSTGERSRQRQESMAKEKERKQKEEIEKQERIANERKEAKLKREEANNKKKMEEEAAAALVEGLGGLPADPPAINNSTKRRGREGDEAANDVNKKQGVGSPMRGTTRTDPPGKKQQSGRYIV